MNQINEPRTRTVVYTAPGLDGAVHRVSATNGTWTIDVMRQFAAYDLEDRNGGLPCDVQDIEILDVRETTYEDEDDETVSYIDIQDRLETEIRDAVFPVANRHGTTVARAAMQNILDEMGGEL